MVFSYGLLFCDAYFMLINQAFMQIHFANIFYITFFIKSCLYIKLLFHLLSFPLSLLLTNCFLKCII